MKGRTVSFKERGGDGRIGVIASGGHTMTVMLRHTASWAPRYYTWLLIEMTPKGVVFSFSFLFHSFFFSFLFSFFLFLFYSTQGDIRDHALLPAGAAKDTDNKPELRTARKSTSRKQLQFAPLQLGHIPAQPSRSPSTGADAEPLSLGRSKSLGSVVDCSLLKDAANAELAVNKDRPHSAQFHRTVLHWALCCIQMHTCVMLTVMVVTLVQLRMFHDITCRSVACFVLVM